MENTAENKDTLDNSKDLNKQSNNNIDNSYYVLLSDEESDTHIVSNNYENMRRMIKLIEKQKRLRRRRKVIRVRNIDFGYMQDMQRLENVYKDEAIKANNKGVVRLQQLESAILDIDGATKKKSTRGINQKQFDFCKKYIYYHVNNLTRVK